MHISTYKQLATDGEVHIPLHLINRIVVLDRSIYRIQRRKISKNNRFLNDLYMSNKNIQGRWSIGQISMLRMRRSMGLYDKKNNHSISHFIFVLVYSVESIHKWRKRFYQSENRKNMIINESKQPIMQIFHHHFHMK